MSKKLKTKILKLKSEKLTTCISLGESVLKWTARHFWVEKRKEKDGDKKEWTLWGILELKLVVLQKRETNVQEFEFDYFVTKSRELWCEFIEKYVKRESSGANWWFWSKFDRESEWKGDEANVRFLWWSPLSYKVKFLFLFFFIHKFEILQRDKSLKKYQIKKRYIIE